MLWNKIFCFSALVNGKKWKMHLISELCAVLKSNDLWLDRTVIRSGILIVLHFRYSKKDHTFVIFFPHVNTNIGELIFLYLVADLSIDRIYSHEINQHWAVRLVQLGLIGIRFTAVSQYIVPLPVLLPSRKSVGMNDTIMNILIWIFGDLCFWLCCTISL